MGLGGVLNPEGSRLFPQIIVYPRHPGKPDPRWTEFQWKFLDLDSKGAKFRLFFYDGEEWITEFVIPLIKEQISSLIEEFEYVPTSKFSYLLLGSRREFQQINIFNISEGVQGITSTIDRTMAIPYWGEVDTFKHISKHELTHQMQIQKFTDLSHSNALTAMSQVPLWFIEGMAEYYSQNGMDPESRQYLRDLLLYPKPENDYSLPNLFDPGQMNFIGIYKIGQAKIDFFETEFGPGTSQKILATGAEKMGEYRARFVKVVSDLVKLSPEQLETKWRDYLYKTYRHESDRLRQSMNEFEEIPEVGETLDLFSISPDGSLLATREIDPSTGVTSIYLRSFSNLKKKTQVIHDRQPGALSLFFMQIPTLTLSNQKIAYIVSTIEGPELELQTIVRNNDGSFDLTNKQRFSLFTNQLSEAHSPAISPDGNSVALVGLSLKGWENVYTIDLSATSDTILKPLTNEYFSWKNLSWESDGIYCTSNKTSDQKYNLRVLHPEVGSEDAQALYPSPNDQLFPSSGSPSASSASNSAKKTSTPETHSIYFQSWSNGTSQIHQIREEEDIPLTEAKVGFTNPQYRQHQIYALGFKSGRYHLYKIPEEKFLNRTGANKLYSSPAKTVGRTAEPWRPELFPLPTSDVKKYTPFLTSGGTRIDNLGAFFSTGAVGGITLTVSDLMRDYTLSGQFAYIGQLGLSNTFLLFGSQRGRSTWDLGGYHVLQPRLDNIFSTDTLIRTYVQRETGFVAALQYPLGAFNFIDLAVRLARVNRTDFNDSSLLAQWNAINPGAEFLVAPIFRFGFDRIIYEAFAGPLEGYGFMAESETNYYPSPTSLNERVRLDFSYYFNIFSNTVIQLQALAGGSWGGTFKNGFLISSDDILRAYAPFDPRLFGNFFLASKVELRYPIGAFFKLPILRGILSYDYGSVFARPERLGSNITSSWAWGLNLSLPPLSVTFLFAYPMRTAILPVEGPTFHFLLRYLYL